MAVISTIALAPARELTQEAISRVTTRGENQNDRHASSAYRSSLAERVGFEPTDPGGSMP